MRSILACAGILVASSLAIFAFQPFGRPGWHVGLIATSLAVLLLLPLVQKAWGHDRLSLRGPRWTLALCFAGWLLLLGWSTFSPGGTPPPANDHASAIRVLSWNILRGADGGPPWLRFRWNVRAQALQAAIQQTEPDVLCVQEALAGQVQFLKQALPQHTRVGVGRDDGRTAGESCAIYFDRVRFEELASGTFWLEGPADSPPRGFSLASRRICTWVRLRDRRTGQRFRVYNTHLQLTESPRQAAARRILEHIAVGESGDSIVIAGDFNAPSSARSRQLFTQAGFVASATALGRAGDRPTNHFYGIRLRSLDAVLLDRSWQVHRSQVVDVKPGNTFPSDHFGVLADIGRRSVHVP